MSPFTAVVLAAALTAAPAAAEVLAPALATIVDRARVECAAIDGGVLDVPDSAGQRIDLTGDGRGWILDHSQLACSSAASLFCGTGGCRLALVVADHATERLSRGWTVVGLGDTPVVVLDVHGSLCGGFNPTPCFEALAWDPETKRFTSLAWRAE